MTEVRMAEAKLSVVRRWLNFMSKRQGDRMPFHRTLGAINLKGTSAVVIMNVIHVPQKLALNFINSVP
jgi:hypothetical protein